MVNVAAEVVLVATTPDDAAQTIFVKFGKLYRARSLLYRSRFLKVNLRFAAFF